MSKLDNVIPPPVVVAIIGGAMAIIAQVAPLPRWASGWHCAFAGAIGALGFLVLALGFRALRRANTTIDPIDLNRTSALMTAGIYRYSRNPMYLGFALMLLGWATFLAVPWALLGPIAFVAFTTRFQIVPEERAIGAKFGRDYDQFRRNVRRWI